VQNAGERVEESLNEDVVKTGEPTVKSENKTASEEHVPEKTEKD
jgi:hypothetical protein